MSRPFYETGTVLYSINNRPHYVFGHTPTGIPRVTELKVTKEGKILPWDGELEYDKILHWSPKYKVWNLYGCPVYEYPSNPNLPIPKF